MPLSAPAAPFLSRRRLPATSVTPSTCAMAPLADAVMTLAVRLYAGRDAAVATRTESLKSRRPAAMEST